LSYQSREKRFQVGDLVVLKPSRFTGPARERVFQIEEVMAEDGIVFAFIVEHEREYMLGSYCYISTDDIDFPSVRSKFKGRKPCE